MVTAIGADLMGPPSERKPDHVELGATCHSWVMPPEPPRNTSRRPSLLADTPPEKLRRLDLGDRGALVDAREEELVGRGHRYAGALELVDLQRDGHARLGLAQHGERARDVGRGHRGARAGWRRSWRRRAPGTSKAPGVPVGTELTIPVPALASPGAHRVRAGDQLVKLDIVSVSAVTEPTAMAVEMQAGASSSSLASLPAATTVAMPAARSWSMAGFCGSPSQCRSPLVSRLARAAEAEVDRRDGERAAQAIDVVEAEDHVRVPGDDAAGIGRAVGGEGRPPRRRRRR